MIRRPDWPERLDAFIRSRRNAPFAWGTNDCLTYCADAILAMTDVDILGEDRGTWANSTEAWAFVERVGGFDQYLAERLRPLQSSLTVKRGDVGLVPAEPADWPTVALCTGRHWCGPHHEGMVMIDIVKPDGTPWAFRSFSTGN